MGANLVEDVDSPVRVHLYTVQWLKVVIGLHVDLDATEHDNLATMEVLNVDDSL